MNELNFLDKEDTYLLSLPGIILHSDLRHELTAEVIVEGINAYMDRVAQEDYLDGCVSEEIKRLLNGLSGLVDGSYHDNPKQIEDVECTIDNIVYFLNKEHLSAYYDPVVGTDNILVEYYYVKPYSSVMMSGQEREWTNFYYITTDPETKSIFVHELDKDEYIPSVVDIYEKLYVDMEEEM